MVCVIRLLVITIVTVAVAGVRIDEEHGVGAATTDDAGRMERRASVDDYDYGGGGGGAAKAAVKHHAKEVAKKDAKKVAKEVAKEVAKPEVHPAVHPAVQPAVHTALHPAPHRAPNSAVHPAVHAATDPAVSSVLEQATPAPTVLEMTEAPPLVRPHSDDAELLARKRARAKAEQVAQVKEGNCLTTEMKAANKDEASANMKAFDDLLTDSSKAFREKVHVRSKWIDARSAMYQAERDTEKATHDLKNAEQERAKADADHTAAVLEASSAAVEKTSAQNMIDEVRMLRKRAAKTLTSQEADKLAMMQTEAADQAVMKMKF